MLLGDIVPEPSRHPSVSDRLPSGNGYFGHFITCIIKTKNFLEESLFAFKDLNIFEKNQSYVNQRSIERSF